MRSQSNVVNIDQQERPNRDSNSSTSEDSEESLPDSSGFFLMFILLNNKINLRRSQSSINKAAPIRSRRWNSPWC